jgi:predicted NUDIX family NTP pyrophosphohydrolase
MPKAPFFWAKKDCGAWCIAKGKKCSEREDALSVAKREFEKETGALPHGDFLPLGEERHELDLCSGSSGAPQNWKCKSHPHGR